MGLDEALLQGPDGLCTAHLNPTRLILGFGAELLDDHQGPGWRLALNTSKKALLEANCSGKNKLAKASGRKIISSSTPQPCGVKRLVMPQCAVKSLCQLIKYNNL